MIIVLITVISISTTAICWNLHNITIELRYNNILKENQQNKEKRV